MRSVPLSRSGVEIFSFFVFLRTSSLRSSWGLGRHQCLFTYLQRHRAEGREGGGDGGGGGKGTTGDRVLGVRPFDCVMRPGVLVSTSKKISLVFRGENFLTRCKSVPVSSPLSLTSTIDRG